MPAALVDSHFRVRRTQNWMMLGLLYALFYMSRYNYSATSAFLAGALGWRNAQLGVFETVMPLVYGLSVFLNGPLADRIGGKRAFLLGTAGAAVMNVTFGFLLRRAIAAHAGAALLPVLAAVWGVNGFFQSFGALSIVKVNAHWFHVQERGTFAGIFGVLIRLGLILAFSGTPIILHTLAVEWVFWVPAMLLVVFFFLNLFLMENSPAEAGLGEFDTGDGDGADDKPAALLDVLAKVFASRVAWTVAGASMMVGFVRRSVIDAWWPKYFADAFHVDPKTFVSYAPYQVASWGIAIAGIAGGFVFGVSSDRIYGGRRGPVITFGFIGMAVLLALIGTADRFHLGPYAAAILLVTLSFFVNGAHGMIGGAASMDFGGKKAAATAAGLFDGMQYVAASTVGYGMGKLIDAAGWKVWTFSIVPFALIGGVLGATLWNAKPRGAAKVGPAPSLAPDHSSPEAGDAPAVE